MVTVSSDNMTGVLVKPDIAKKQFDTETATAPTLAATGADAAGTLIDGHPRGSNDPTD
jgi:hypothetical protein